MMNHPVKEIDTELAKVISALPFIGQLPLPLLRNIDTASFIIPYGTVAHIRHYLEANLNCHIMTYKSVYDSSDDPEKLHLCRLLEPAALTRDQLRQLRRAEEELSTEGVILVAYAKAFHNLIVGRTSETTG